MSTDSPLNVIIKAGLMALKTPLCLRNDSKLDTCPLCYRKFEELARELPMATKTYTSLICRILGFAMNENNPPLALPNGQAYSALGIKRIKKNDKIECPVTQKQFSDKQLIKIYGLT